MTSAIDYYILYIVYFFFKTGTMTFMYFQREILRRKKCTKISGKAKISI